MRIWKRILFKRVRSIALLSLITILAIPFIVAACIPRDATQTVATPAPPLTDLSSISPSRSRQPTASPGAASRPSVSPDADAIIPIPGQSTLPSIVPIPSPFVTPSPSTPPESIDLTAQNGAFDRNAITVPAGAQVTINFNNQDAGIYNNFALYVDQSAKDSIFVGNVIIGPDSTTYSFSAPDQKGTYFFRSDDHPGMNGQFVVQ
jgi:hypothetical protein